MQEINAWLTGTRDFTQGANLYRRYGTNTFFKDMLEAGPTPYNTKKLGEELQALAPSAPAILEVESGKLKVESKEHVTAPANSKEEHSRYLRLQEERKIIYMQLERNMAALDFLPDGSQLHETAKQILSLHKKLTHNYSQTDYYEQYGAFPYIEEKVIKTDEKQRLYVSISKAKKRLSDPNAKNPEKTKKTLLKLQARLKELEERE